MHLKVIFLAVLLGSFLYYVKADASACRFPSCSGTLSLKCSDSTTIRLGDLKFDGIVAEDQKFNDTETLAIYSSCSYKYKCDYEVPDWHGYFWVYVQFWCVEPNTVVQLTANIKASKEGELNLIYDMTDMTDTNTAPMYVISCDVISNTSGLNIWIEDFRGCPITKLYYNDAEEPIVCSHSIGMYRKRLPVQEKEYHETSGQLLYNFTIHVKHNQPKGMFWLRFKAFELKRITLECSPINPPTMMSHQPTLTSQISQETPSTSRTTSSSAVDVSLIIPPTMTSHQPTLTSHISQEAPSTSRTTSSSADQLTKNENKDNTGAVVGAVVTVVLVVAMVSVGCFIYQRRKRKQSTSGDCKVAHNLSYDVTSVPERDADQTREPDQTEPAKHTTESQYDSIYHGPGTSSDVAGVSFDINEEDYNKIDLHSKKAFSVDLNYDILAPHARFVTGPNYSHISDVTTARNDTYSHIPTQQGTTTQGKKDESYSDDTYNHLTNTARLEVRDNNKDFSDEYSNIGNLPMTKNAGQQTPHKIALDKQHGEKLSDLKQNLGEFVPALPNQNGRQMKASFDGMTNMSRSQVTDVNAGREINDVRNHRKTSEDSDHTYFVLEKQ